MKLPPKSYLPRTTEHYVCMCLCVWNSRQASACSVQSQTISAFASSILGNQHITSFFLGCLKCQVEDSNISLDDTVNIRDKDGQNHLEPWPVVIEFLRTNGSLLLDFWPADLLGAPRQRAFVWGLIQIHHHHATLIVN
jgi:hypothetical protein